MKYFFLKFGLMLHHCSNWFRNHYLCLQTVSKFGKVDILVSNAAVNPVFGPVLNCSEESWDKIFDINVKAAFLLAQTVVPHMEKRGGGSILLVSSIAGFQPFSVIFSRKYFCTLNNNYYTGSWCLFSEQDSIIGFDKGIHN